MHINTEPHCDTGYGTVPEFSQVVSFGTEHAVIERRVGCEHRQIVAVRDVREGRSGLHKRFDDREPRAILNKHRKLPAVSCIVREGLVTPAVPEPINKKCS